MNKRLVYIAIFTLSVFCSFVYGQRDLGARPTDSGGVLMAEQAAYDAKSYDLDVRPNIEEQSIKDVRRENRIPDFVRPSFVLGGRAMAIVYDEQSLDEYMRSAVDASPQKPILIDKFLERE